MIKNINYYIIKILNISIIWLKILIWTYIEYVKKLLKKYLNYHLGEIESKLFRKTINIWKNK